ncbi:putative reverse transcriptase domain-containing protein [Tanacetum coccineum]
MTRKGRYETILNEIVIVKKLMRRWCLMIAMVKRLLLREQALPLVRFPMINVASWNIRGLNFTPKQNEVRQVISENNLSVFAILESHVVKSKLMKCALWFFDIGIGSSNGAWCSKGTRIILGWNHNEVDVTIINQNDQAVHSRLWLKKEKKEIFCTFVYAHNKYNQRRDLWNALCLHKVFVNNRPWCLLGDFNATLHLSESTASSSCIDIAMREFKDCVNNIEVLDVQNTGLQFTWNQKPKVKPKPFKFFNVLVKHDRFKEVVNEAWNYHVSGFYMFRMVKKLKNLKKPLRKLLIDKGNLHANVERIRGELDTIQTQLDIDPFNIRLREIEAANVVAFNQAVLDEEMFLKQKAKISWLKDGDSNTAYFHKSVKSRVSRSRIDVISNSDGIIFANDKVPDAFVAHYEAFLGQTGKKGSSSGYCDKLELINLCFADDLFIFAYGDVQSVVVIKECLDEFKHASGLIPSIPKSTAFFCNVLNHVKLSILNVLPFEEGRLPVKYLGVPLVSSRLKARDCKELVEKVQNRVLDWKNKALSRAVRPLIIRSVISLLQCFGLRSSKVRPKWRGSLVCLPKEKVVSWVHAYKLNGRNFWDVPIRGNMSWSWRKILQLRSSIRDFIWRKIGNGSSTSIWFDKWCHEGPLASRVSPRDIHRAGLTLYSHVGDIIRDGDWDRVSIWDYSNVLGSTCPLCEVPGFTLNLFFICPFANSVWSRMKVKAGLGRVSHNIYDIVDHLGGIAGRKTTHVVIAKLVVAASAYFIWQERNWRLFKKSKRSIDQVTNVSRKQIGIKSLVMSSASSAVTYTSVYTDSEPGRVFWGADEEISDGGSPRVIVYGYDGLPMQPVDPPSPDYVPGPEHPPSPIEIPYVPEPEYPEYLVPSEDEAPMEDQPLPVDASPAALSPGYVPDSDPEEDPEEDSEEHADYPADGGDGDDEPSDDDSDDDTDDDDEEPFEDEEDDEEEEEHLAPADSSAIPVVDPVPSAGDTEAFETDESAPTPRSSQIRVPFAQTRLRRARKTVRPEPPMSASMEARIAEYAAAPTPPLPVASPPLPLPSPLTTSPTDAGAPLGYRAAGIQMRVAAASPPLLLPSTSYRTDVPKAEMPPRKRACFTTPATGCEIGESSAVGAARQPGPTPEADTWDEIVEAMMEIAPTTLEGVNQKVTKLDTTVRQRTDEFQVPFEEAYDDRAYLRARVNTLFRDRPYHRHTALALDREAVYARIAWTGSEERSAAIEAHVRTLEAQVATLIAQTTSLQTQLTTVLGCIETLEARDPEPQDGPTEADSSC